MIRRKISLLFGCLLCMLAATAQIRGNEIRVMVSPDHTDWNYRLNDKCTFTVRVLKAHNPPSRSAKDSEPSAPSR